MDILIFDMDGVLIDVSKSYRKAIQRAIQIYLETCLGFKRKRRDWVTNEEISLFKSAGGFNNDWDLTSALLLYLISISSLPPSPKRKKVSSISEAVSHLKKRSDPFRRKMAHLLQKKKLRSFIKKVESAGGGLAGVRRTLGTSWEGWVYQNGEIDQENLVKRIFQEVYLGKKFTSCYHLKPIFFRKKGLYLRERLLIPKKILSSLHKKLRLGIASGRPRFEAELALKRFRLLTYFDSVVTLDEVLEEEDRFFHSTGRRVKYSKPHPYSLFRVIQEVGIPSPRCGYVGDVVDDLLAVKALKERFQITAIISMSTRGNRQAVRESFLKAGADQVITNPKELPLLVS
jgi:HAD superfamily phosphatase